MGEEADADWEAGLVEWGQEDAKGTCRIRPHTYIPSYQHMGDCAVCGHGQGSLLHQNPKR